MDHLECNDDEERSKIRGELSSMSFEELRKLKEKIGAKIVDDTLFGRKEARKERPASFTRENKNRPREMPSKTKSAKRIKKVKDVVRKKALRDPRFDDLSGTFDERLFRKSYGFVAEMREKEMEVLKKRMKKTEDANQRQAIQTLVLQMKEKEKTEVKKKEDEERRRTHKREQLENIRQGKKPFFLKKSELKKESLIEKYEKLKKSGKLESYMSKKRKQNAAKEKKKLPSNVQ